MRILVVGGGGREHALAWRLRQDEPSARLYAAPGNPGIAELADCVAIGGTDVATLAAFARQESIDWTLVGPEAPLEAGIVDAFRAEGLPIFGPTRAAAMLETSKAFAKRLMLDAGIPTARAMVVNDLDGARRAISELGAPVVVKASGLAAGKGVIICATSDEALAAAGSMLEGEAFGAAGATVVIEELMEGEELSVFVLTDGERVVPLPAAQDHKRLLDGDAGPNTGGMGAYSPVSILEASPALLDETLDRIVHPTLAAMRARGAPFTGLLYVGLMLTDAGPKVVEFNCRYGDPETEAVLPAIDPTESVAGLMAEIALSGRIESAPLLETTRAAVTTVLAAPGYPARPITGGRIEIPVPPADVLAFHAGTKRSADGSLLTAGGRVLAITGLGDTMEDAQRRSQTFAASVSFPDKQFRTDIGWRELARRAGASRD